MSHSASSTESGTEFGKNIPILFRPLLTEGVVVRTVDSGDPITRTGDANDRILCILSGRAQVVLGYRATQEVIVESLEPGDVFGDLGFLTGRRWPVDAGLVATEPTEVLEISVNTFQRLLRENPEFTVALLKSLGKKTIRVDRLEFSSAEITETGPASVCAYPSHPGIPHDVQLRFQALAISNESVLIIGETGVGKDVLAYAIFDAADKDNEVLVPVNVKQIGTESFFLQKKAGPPSKERGLTTDQIWALFGREMVLRADGTTRVLPGYLDLAREGTLFVRGAHLLSAVAQQKLLDALKTGFYCSMGGSERIKADFRLICTTELDPSQFSPDRHPLLYELQRTALIIPPLRERRTVIPALATHYLSHYAREVNKRPPELEDITLKAMVDYSWPGNDLELANAMRRAVLITPGSTVRRQDLTFDKQRTERGTRYNLLKLKPIRQALASPLFPAVLQSAFLPVFLGIVMLLFLGPADASKNLAAVIMWSLAWPSVILGAFFGARISCSICAIGALSTLAKRIVSLELEFPESLRMRSDFLIAGGILFIIWLESVLNMRSSPSSLGMLLVTMFLVAFVLNTLFARQTWCRYLCPLGGMTGLFARTSMVELRADSAICLSECSSHECYYGSRKTEGCPFGQVVATLHSNQFCKICGNCVKSCPYNAINLNVRIPGHELGEVRHVRTGTGFLVLALNGALLSDIITRTPLYDKLTDWLPVSGTLKFTLIYIGFIAAVNAIALIASLLSHHAFRERYWENYSRFALSLLPLTCAGFLAFHLYYFFTLWPDLLQLLGKYSGVDALAGSVSSVSGSFITRVQQIVIVGGCLWSLVTMSRLGASSPRGRFRRRWGVLPHIALDIILAGLLLMAMMNAFPE